MLLTEFRDFLGAFKNAESLSDQLREAIAVETGLEEAVRTAIGEGRCVVIAGSAGSGKTHLLRHVVRSLQDKYAVALPGDRPRVAHLLVVEDATELDANERLAVVDSVSRSRAGTLLAINEGPLLEAARAGPESALARSLRLLHGARRGIVSAFESDAPTVVDMGAFDALNQEVVTRILGLTLLREAVLQAPCDCDPEDCPRRRAWQQLESADVRARVGAVLGIVHVLEREWLFRDLWDFVADIALGGSCAESPPSSPWFWRTFYGDSRLATALRELVAPDDIALPQLDARIYYGDWGSELLGGLVPGVDLVRESQSGNVDGDFGPFRYMKAQVLFLHRDIDLAERATTIASGSFRSMLVQRRIGPVLRAVNEYFAFGLRTGSETVLDLFVEHGVERRTELIQGVIKLGDAAAADFELRKPQVIVNHPKNVTNEGTGALYLVHAPSNSSLRLDGERMRLLQRGRTLRIADREQLDLDWDLCQFFEGILRLKKWPSEFIVVKCDFGRLAGDERRYRASPHRAIVEEA